MSDGMVTRARRIDGGEPLLLFDPPEEGVDVLAVSTAACSNPECPCTRMELTIRRGTRHGDRFKLSGAPLRFEMSSDGLDLQLDEDTREAFTDAATEWAAELLGDERHRGWFRERWARMRGQVGDQAYPSGSPPEDIDGLVSFSEVFPYDFDLTVVHQQKLYLADDQYCLEPRCKCDEVSVQFIDVSSNEDGKKARWVGTGRARLRRLPAPTLEGDRATRRLWATLLEQHRAADLKARFERMRAVARSRAPAAPAPTSASAKPGRNAPCPCGSGNKYKRCCGR